MRFCRQFLGPRLRRWLWVPSSLQEGLLLAGVLVIIGDALVSRELLGSDHYAMLDGQGCSQGYQNLHSMDECSAAARGLGLIHKSQAARLAGQSYFPYGCYWIQTNVAGARLYFNPYGNYSSHALAPRQSLLGHKIRLTDRTVICQRSSTAKPELMDDAQRPLPPAQHSHACIVRMNALALSLCSARRLAALVAGKEKACDVWLLMDSVALVDAWTMGYQNMTWPPPKNIQAVLNPVGIRTYFYNTKNMGDFLKSTHVKEFGGLTGASAQSIIRFMARPDFTYSHAWVIEDDIFYTGNLGPVLSFANAGLGDADYAATGYTYPADGVWVPRLRCRVKAKQLALVKKKSAHHQRRLNWSNWERCNAPPPWTCCLDIEPGPNMQWINEQTNWFFARFSKRLAVKMLAMLEEGAIYAHHELYPYRACSLLRSPGCTPIDLRQRRELGIAFHNSFAAGGNWGVFRGIKNSSNPAFQLGRGGAGWNPGENEGRMDEPVVVTDQRLYHPVKCAADPTLGQQALKFTRVSP